MEPVFIRTSSRPAFVSPGFSFLIKPKFVIDENLILSFNWEIRCIKNLPALSLSIAKITKGSGCHAVDLSRYFILPEKMKFPETAALPKKMCAQVEAHCNLKFVDFKEIPVGLFRLVIEIVFWGQTHQISQNFILQRITVL